MTKHTRRGTRLDLYVDDGFGNCRLITFQQLVTRIVSGWPEL
jgi:hypothetical protein